mgnify:FL=1
MIPGRIVGWHVNAKIPTQVDGYRVNDKGGLAPYTTIVAEVPGYFVERERIAKVIAESEEALDLIVTLKRNLRHAPDCTNPRKGQYAMGAAQPCTCGVNELWTRADAYAKLTR